MDGSEVIELVQRYCICFNIHIPSNYNYDHFNYLFPRYDAEKLRIVIDIKQKSLIGFVNNSYILDNKHHKLIYISSLIKLLRSDTLKEFMT